MSDIPQNLKYTKSHEWIRTEKDNCLVIGITDHAQQQLGDIVYVGLPNVDDILQQEATSAVVESVKAASDIYMPVDGTVIEVNEALNDNPALINESPYEDGWLFKITTQQQPEALSATEYAQVIKE